MKRTLILILIILLVSSMTVGTVKAQSGEQLQLGNSRINGYGGIGIDIQGVFALKIINPPADLERVEFYLDKTVMGEVKNPPFNLTYNTDSYPLGLHTLRAIGYTTTGNEILSNDIQVNFVPASEGTKVLLKIIIPVLGLILLLVIVSVGVPLLSSRDKPVSLPLGAERHYGVGGGAICPKCGRPFQLKLWWINLGLHKIDRCPYCGKWSLVRPKSIDQLRAAEGAELKGAQPEIGSINGSESDKLKKELDDSRYQDG